MGAQTKMQGRSMMALVTAAAVDFIDLDEVTAHHLDPCPDAVFIGLYAIKADLDPVVFVG